MKTRLLIPCALLPLFAAAQSASDESAIIKLVEHNDTSTLFVTIHENAPHKINIKDVPRFAILGKEGKFYMGLGANVKVVPTYDFGNPIPNPNLFVTSGIPMNLAPGNGAQFKVSAQQSNIYLNVVALPGTKDQLGAYVSMNFLGSGYAPTLQHAYLKYRDIIAGYTYTIFADAAAVPATIDYEGPNGLATIIHGMVAYEPYLGKNREWRVGIGLDMPETSITNADRTLSVSQRLPDIPFYVQRNWAGGAGWIRLAGIVRNMYYRDAVAQKNIDKVGWGIKASGTTPIAGGLSASYMGLYGKGIASYIQDINGLGMDLMPDPSNPSRLEAVKAWSAVGSLQYKFSPKLFCTAIYSHVRTYADRYSDSPSDWKTGYKYAQYVVGNVFYNINSIVQVGAEYIYGRRVDFDGSQAHDNRVEAMLQVSF